jgi:UDP-2,3-diacylglucosamine hydrolase
MRDKIVFFSDLHLSDEVPERVVRFFRILERLRGETHTIYLLGDTFDFWIGPKNERLSPYREILGTFRSLVKEGIAIHFLAGNRDFYGLDRLRQRYGLITHDNDLLVRLAGRNVFVSHGDRLCAKDVNSDRARAIIRHPLTEKLFTSLPTRFARFLGKGYRNYSQRNTRNKPTRIVELCEQTLFSILVRDDVDMIVCGHTHRTQERVFRTRNGNRRKVVYTLGSWHGGSPYLVCGNGGFTLHA